MPKTTTKGTGKQKASSAGKSKVKGRPRTVSDHDIATLLGEGRTHQQIADELGLSRVGITSRIGKLKQSNPDLLESTSIDKFRESESDQVARARQHILNAVLNRVVSPKGLNRESLPQLIKSFAILWDKDEKIQDKMRVMKHAHIVRHELDQKSQELLDSLMAHRKEQALMLAMGDKVDEVIADHEAPTQLTDYYEADYTDEEGSIGDPEGESDVRSD